MVGYGPDVGRHTPSDRVSVRCAVLGSYTAMIPPPFEKTYCAEAVTDIEQDIFEWLDYLPFDQQGLILGRVKVTVEFIPVIVVEDNSASAG